MLTTNVNRKDTVLHTIMLAHISEQLFFISYDDQLLVEYKVQCRANQLAFFNITTMDLEGRTCIDEDGNPKFIKQIVSITVLII